jgi:excisionase family DNA binding protein
VNTETLAHRLSCRIDHIRALVARRAIPHGRVGRLVRFNLVEIERWLVDSANRDVADGEVLS